MTIATIKSVALDFFAVFFGVLAMQAVTFGAKLFDIGVAEWKQAAASAVVAALAVVIAALHPAMSRYGVGAMK
jgi:hypothetical protein